MRKAQRAAVILELEKILADNGIAYYYEVLFNSVMNTRRQFRADYYLPELKAIIEINGGQFKGGRHNRGGAGYENDLMKSNIANLHGFTYLQFTYEMLGRGMLQGFVEQLVITKGSK